MSADIFLSNKNQVQNLIKKRWFFSPSFEDQGGLSGFYDYGPLGYRLKENIVNVWKQFFTLNEKVCILDCSVFTKQCVLENSGHTQKFNDIFVRDTKTGTRYRADQIIDNYCKIKNLTDSVDYTNTQSIDDFIKGYDIRSPDQNQLTPSVKFNLMFQSDIGVEGNTFAYLRPETAQGLFTNFAKLYQYYGERLPFAAAQIGKAYRNEVSPKNGLIRLREFDMAELEYFYNPLQASFHETFELKDLGKIQVIDSNEQIKHANLESYFNSTDSGGNQTMHYFIQTSLLFLQKIGIDLRYVRLKQHSQNNLAHYAKSCCDIEILGSAGWTECIGIADRGCFDLQAHFPTLMLKFQNNVFTPNVIEPSFGLSRLVQHVLEHSFCQSTSCFKFNQLIAPYKIGLLTLNDKKLCDKLHSVKEFLREHHIQFTHDDSCSSYWKKVCQNG